MNNQLDIQYKEEDDMMFYVFNDASVCVLETENKNQAIDYAARIDGYYCTDDEQEDEVD